MKIIKDVAYKLSGLVVLRTAIKISTRGVDLAPGSDKYYAILRKECIRFTQLYPGNFTLEHEWVIDKKELLLLMMVHPGLKDFLENNKNDN